ncbi:Nitrogen assimilation regulatory protein [compost metagenome]
MPLPMQVKLLRVLQERLFDRVGGSKPVQADVRVIAATHRDLEALIRTQGFREDLYYRLNVFPIETPPLRERADDIPLLLQELLNRHAEQHRGLIRLTQRAMESLMQYAWPGNVRELSNLIERLLILYPNQIVDVADLPGRYRLLPCEPRDERLTEMDERDALAAVFQSLPEPEPGSAIVLPMQLPLEGVNLKEMLADLEVELIRQALETQEGVVARAADLLSMRRTTLVEKMKKYGMSKEA